jgi:Uma2 family endonuclease
MPGIRPEEVIMRADRMNLRLEIVRGIPIWEASPVFAHQQEIDRIRSTIRAVSGFSCHCIHISDAIFRFPDDSLKRPDIAILCNAPGPEEAWQPLTMIPEAVVEIISQGYEEKDLEIAPGFYLAMGVKDVFIFDPQLKQIYYHRRDGKKRLDSPTRFDLECGCSLEI